VHRNLAESSKPHTFRTKESRFVTIVCFVLLMISVYYWLVTKADGSPAGQFGALVNAALYSKGLIERVRRELEPKAGFM
jgi:hypothetical protein